jgi:CTD small phosphatase-like protein 2
MNKKESKENKESKEKQYKLKSSITLIKNPLNRKPIENQKGNHYKRHLTRRHTIFALNDKQKSSIFNEKKRNNNNKEINGLCLNYDYDDNGYIDDCSSKNESMDEKVTKMKMKIDKITEDKLVLNYQNKNETIELLSDKENINNYYEYLDLCLETMQEINLKEVPKSKARIDFKFPNDRKNKKIALFDLDETLVHCIGEINKNNKDDPIFADAHKVKVVLPNKKEVMIGINVRPHLKKLFDTIKEEYNVAIFTASHQSYSDAVLNYLDPEDQYFHYRLYRDSCVQYKKNDINFYVKDLDIFKYNYDLKDIIIIDNSILSFAYHFNNGIPVVPFYDSKQDNELPLLCFYLLSIASYKDLREANKEHIKLEFFLSQIKKEISLDEGTTINENISLKDKTIENSIKKMSNKNTANNNEKEYNSDKKVNEFDANDIEIEDINYNNRSAKKLSYELIEGKSIYNRRKFNTVKLESYKIIDFFEKWKNAYLQRALKK